MYKTVGDFDVEVGDPSPRWITIRQRNWSNKEIRFTEYEVDDLEYIVKIIKKAIEEDKK